MPGSAEETHVGGALAAAEALAGEGRSLEAVDLLTEANRRERDDAIEARLVLLRNAAFGEIDRAPTDSPWPDDETRPREGSVELPPIDRADLTPELVRDHILRYGCAYIPGLLSSEQSDQLVEGIDRAFDGCDAQAAGGWSRESAEGEGATDAETGPWYVRFDPDEDKIVHGNKIRGETRKFVRKGAGVWTIESPRVMFEFLEMLEGAGVRSLIGDYLGERPAVTLKKSTLRRVPPLPHADWHQDGAFLGESIRTINLWLSLSRCGDDAPGLDLVPRRLDHIAETGTGGAFFEWSVGPDTAKQEAGDVPVIRPIFQPGDALLFDELFLHRTATNDQMTRNRYALETWFFAPSLYPDDQIPFVW